jgi:hypothetical protein
MMEYVANQQTTWVMLTEDYLNIAYDPEAPKNAILL